MMIFLTMTAILHFGVLWGSAGMKPCQSGTVLAGLLRVIRRGGEDLGKFYCGEDVTLAESLFE